MSGEVVVITLLWRPAVTPFDQRFKSPCEPSSSDTCKLGGCREEAGKPRAGVKEVLRSVPSYASLQHVA